MSEITMIKGQINTEFFDLSPDDQFRVRWTILNRQKNNLIKLFKIFHDLYDGDEIDGSKKKKTAPRPELQLQRQMYRDALKANTNAQYQMLQQLYSKPDANGKRMFRKDLLNERDIE